MNLPLGKTPLEKSNTVLKTQFLNNINKKPENVYFREDMMKNSAAFCIKSTDPKLSVLYFFAFAGNFLIRYSDI